MLPARIARRPAPLVVALVAASALIAVACSSDNKTAATTTTTASAPSTTSTTEVAGSDVIVFNAQGNNLDAYNSEPPFASQRVITNRAEDPQGLDINAQICFFPDGSKRFVAGEDTGQTAGQTQGWGIFQLTGDRVGNFEAREVGKLVPTYQPSNNNAENYGCGILSDGRIVTTDVGNQASGPGDGQLIVWYPPYDSRAVRYCKVDIGIATAQSIWVDDQDRVYVASARPPSAGGQTAGVWRYSNLPTGPDAAGGCGQTDPTGAPLVDQVRKEMFIPGGDNGLASPTGVAGAPDGHLFVSSVITGVINEYDANGQFVRNILSPPAGEELGTKPFSTGTPLGIAVGPDGTIYYADIGITNEGGDVGPGDKAGSVRRIVFTNGQPQAPETMAAGLDFPDGIGLLILAGGGGSASIA